MTLIDITGQKFGRLTVISKADTISPGGANWNCVCACGKKTVVRSQLLRNGITKSCGCLSIELAVRRLTKHGRTGTREFLSWSKMIARCENPNKEHYERYGGRGIRVCDRWRNSFKLFLSDMGPRPSPKHSIDRIDNDGNYEPGNCRWATQKEQCRNKSTNKLLTAFGRTQTQSEWSEETGIRISTIIRRLKRGLSDEESLAPTGHTPRKRFEMWDEAKHQ